MKTLVAKHFKPPFAIVGGGISGQAARDLLLACGFRDKQEVTLFDDKLNTAHYSDSSKLLREFKPQTLIVSPGVPLSTPWIAQAIKDGLTLSSELSLAALFFDSEKIIGVTGSLGKSTTVSLLGAGLHKFSSTGFVGGNIGVPLARYAQQLLQGRRPRADWIVLELSSYQLENSQTLPIDFAVLTYLSSNHLERYQDLNHYYSTKWTLVARSKNGAVLNGRGGDLVAFAKKQNEYDRCVVTDALHTELTPAQLQSSQLVGEHNLDNVAVATKTAQMAGWPSYVCQGILEFSGLAHRMQNLGLIGGVRFINDSKATAMESVLTATEGLPAAKNRRFILLGGKDKKLPWEKLSVLKSKDFIFLFFGECASLAKDKSGLSGPCFTKLREAVTHVKTLAQPGDTVLLSPGGTSLDEFKNFEHRGQEFEKYAREIFGAAQ